MATRTNSVRNAVIAVVIGLLIQIAFVASFVAAQVDPQPHDVPVGVVGPQPAVGQVEQALERRSPGGLEIRAYPSPGAAETAIGDREVYGALLLGQERLQLLTASAASPAVSNLLVAVAGGVARASGQQLQVRDVRPIDPDDPRGLVLNLLMLPFVVTAVLVSLFLRFLAPALRPGGQLAALAAFAICGALVSILIAGPIAGALPGSFLALSAIVALLLFSIAAATTGLVTLRGAGGVGLGFLIFLIIGNIASGAATAPELLPGFWRAVGPWLPPGAAATAMRNVAYFDGVELLQPLLVLVAFSAIGAALTVLVGRRQVGTPLFPSPPGMEATVARTPRPAPTASA